MYEVMWNIVCFLTLIGTIWNSAEIAIIRREGKHHDTPV